METREEGFYWVRHDQDWQPVHLDKEQIENKNGYWCEIGPKIEPPVNKDDGAKEHRDAIYKYARPTLTTAKRNTENIFPVLPKGGTYEENR